MGQMLAGDALPGSILLARSHAELQPLAAFAAAVLPGPTSTALGTFAATAAENFRGLDVEHPSTAQVLEFLRCSGGHSPQAPQHLDFLNFLRDLR
jgi:hypothetical protein